MQMLGLLAKRKQCSKTLIRFKPFLSSTAFKSSTTLQSDPKGDTFTVPFLVNSCGVPNDAAKRISNYLTLKSGDNPYRVLNFFKTCGFTDAQIPRIVRIVPKVLLFDPDKTLKPKFDLFASLGAPPESVLKIIFKCPQIMGISLDNRMARVLDCLKTVTGSNEEVLQIVARSQLIPVPVNHLESNFAVLREFGMSSSRICRFIKMNARSLVTPPNRFKAMAEKALAMGFDPSKQNFGDAINSFTAINETFWDRKVNYFKKCGWTDSEFFMAFKKYPRIMVMSQKKTERTMDYIVNTFGLNASVIARCPTVLQYSLENRIIPRFSVVQLLVSKGLIEKDDLSILTVLARVDEDFLQLFVKKYEETQDELMDVYSRLKKESHEKTNPSMLSDL